MLVVSSKNKDAAKRTAQLHDRSLGAYILLVVTLLVFIGWALAPGVTSKQVTFHVMVIMCVVSAIAVITAILARWTLRSHLKSRKVRRLDNENLRGYRKLVKELGIPWDRDSLFDRQEVRDLATKEWDDSKRAEVRRSRTTRT